MKIRNFERHDINELIRIHEQYSDQFGIEEFREEFKSFFTVTDDENKVIVMGGVRLIPEIVILTDKAAPPKYKAKAVRLIDQAIRFVSSQDKLTTLHAFIQEESWLKVLLRKGYRLTKGTAVVTDL